MLWFYFLFIFFKAKSVIGNHYYESNILLKYVLLMSHFAQSNVH